VNLYSYCESGNDCVATDCSSKLDRRHQAFCRHVVAHASQRPFAEDFMSRQWTLRIVAGALALSGAVVACYNEVPGPQGPLPAPSREAPPMGGPTGPILPIARLAPAPDAGMRVPQAQPAKLAVAAAGELTDAGVDSPADLPPETPDAAPNILPDAGKPLAQ
jgi:hypothetical protein